MIHLTRQTLEKYQVLIYFVAVGSGLVIGMAQPMWLRTLEAALRPVLALLLYTTFTQVPLAHLRESIADRRFILAAVVGNFLIVPALVAGLAQFLPSDVAIRLGVLMVLLVPCTDWFITFTHLAAEIPDAPSLSPRSACCCRASCCRCISGSSSARRWGWRWCGARC